MKLEIFATISSQYKIKQHHLGSRERMPCIFCLELFKFSKYFLNTKNEIFQFLLFLIQLAHYLFVTWMRLWRNQNILLYTFFCLVLLVLLCDLPMMLLHFSLNFELEFLGKSFRFLLFHVSKKEEILQHRSIKILIYSSQKEHF